MKIFADKDFLPVLKRFALMGTVALFAACGDDTSSVKPGPKNRAVLPRTSPGVLQVRSTMHPVVPPSRLRQNSLRPNSRAVLPRAIP